MAQPEITDFMKTYTEIIGGVINEKMGYGSKLTSFFKERRQTWTGGEGFAKKKVQYGRLGVTADAEADFVAGDNSAYPEAIQANSAANYGGDSSAENQGNNNVDPPTDIVLFNQSEEGFGLIQKAWESEDITVESFRAAAQNADQLASMTSMLTKYASENWMRTYRDEFSRISGNRFVALANGAFTENGDAYECFDASQVARWNKYGFSSTAYDVAGTIDTPDKQNTAALSWKHLDEIQLRILQEDPTGSYATAMADGMPVCVLVTDALTLRSLKNSTDALTYGVRTDLRESNMSSELLKGLGVQLAINGWIILADVTPRKFTITGDSGDSTGATGTGVWSEQEFLTVSGRKRVINSAYRNAEFTESYVFLPKAFSSFNPVPNYAGAGDLTFTAQDYSGEYQFAVIKEKARNPDGAHGFFRGKIATANVAEEKDVLYTIRHRVGGGFAA